MRPRNLLVLAAVVAVLGAFIWFVERDLPSTEERGERAKKVLPLEAADVVAVAIEVDDAVTRLEKATVAKTHAGGEDKEGDLGVAPSEPEWRLVQPMTARADGDAVGDLIDSLTDLEKERTLEDAEPAALGLAEPRATVTLTTEKEERTLRVGEEVPASDNVIVALAGQTVAFVVADSFWTDLTRPSGDWRSREAFTAGRDDVNAVRLRGATEVALRRTGEGFVVEEPFADEADSDQVDELLAALTGLEIESFLDGPLDPAALGLAPAAATVTVTVAGEAEPVEIALGSTAAAVDDEETRYVGIGDQRFTAETDLADLAGLEPVAWRSTTWTRLEVYEIDAIEVRRGDTTLSLERAEGDWRRDGEEIAYTTASDLLYAVRDAETEKVVERVAADLGGEPLYEITLTADEGSETLRLYAATDAGYPAERVSRDPVLFLASGSVDELVAKIEAAQRAEPLPAADEPDPEPATD